MDGDPEKLRRTPLDVGATQPIDEGAVRRARMLGELNEKFSDELSGKAIRYGGNEYEFVQVMLEDETKDRPGAGDFIVLLRQKGTDFVTKVDPDTFREQFTVS